METIDLEKLMQERIQHGFHTRKGGVFMLTPVVTPLVPVKGSSIPADPFRLEGRKRQDGDGKMRGIDRAD
ncbi:hypothetical protein MUK42_37327 [Musa troglodytarum]|uniref:Uncharacterized protein n=1 Tax=Musa troglodytarum TaxID=320322 RepID=A0A9E7J953_9LILI|nr:hypothetical protein MUK42_37327 [Musa troglodytarum]